MFDTMEESRKCKSKLVGKKGISYLVIYILKYDRPNLCVHRVRNHVGWDAHEKEECKRAW